MNRPAAQAGDPVAAIDTPALVVDLDALERNIERMAAYARGHGMRLRPHAKTHKSAAIARLQLAAGAVGVCVQKLDEAQALADGGIVDIFVSNQIVDPAKLARLAARMTLRSSPSSNRNAARPCDTNGSWTGPPAADGSRCTCCRTWPTTATCCRPRTASTSW